MKSLLLSLTLHFAVLIFVFAAFASPHLSRVVVEMTERADAKTEEAPAPPAKKLAPAVKSKLVRVAKLNQPVIPRESSPDVPPNPQFASAATQDASVAKAKNSAADSRDVSNSDDSTNSSEVDSQRLNAEKEDYLSGLRMTIEKFKKYPSLARARRQTGKVEIALDLQLDGSFTNIQLQSATNFSLLNDAALEAVSGAHCYKPIPKSMKTASVHVIIPILFTLD